MLWQQSVSSIQKNRQPCTYNEAYASLLLILIYVDLKCKHIAGVNNTTADYLSCNNLHSFFSLHPQPTPTYTTATTPDARSESPRLDIAPIQAAIQYYYQNGLATVTLRWYFTGQHRYTQFCKQANCIGIPTTEAHCCCLQPTWHD